MAKYRVYWDNPGMDIRGSDSGVAYKVYLVSLAFSVILVFIHGAGTFIAGTTW